MKRIGFLIFSGLIIFLCGCVTTQEQFVSLEGRVINLESRLDTLETKVKQMEKRYEASSEVEGRDIYQALKSLENEIYNMRGDIDTNTADIADIKRKLQDMELEIIEIKKIVEQKLLAKTSNATVSEKPSGAQQKIAPEALYSTALELIKSSQFQEGIKKLEKFLRLYPDHPLASNAFYWIGEAYYGLGKYRDAILQFEDFRRKYPKSTKVPSSLLKEALAFLKLQDKGAARILLNKLLRDYPKSLEAQKAKELLKTLK